MRYVPPVIGGPTKWTERKLTDLITRLHNSLGGSGGGVTDHGALTGLADDDHTQYAKKASNLSDLTNAATARTNLGLGSLATKNSIVEADITDLSHYTSGDFDTDFASKTTDNLSEGTTNLYYPSADKSKLAGIEANADVTDATNVGSAMSGATAKTTPVDADTMPLNDSGASNALKKVTWSNIKATLKSYFDTLYAAITHTHTESDITDLVHDATKIQGKTVDATAIANGKILKYNSTSGNLEYQTDQDTTDHTALSNIGTNTHAQIDTHIGSTSNPHSVTALQVGNTTAQWNANKLQGRAVATTAPTDAQALAWNATTSEWEPQTISGGGSSSPLTTKGDLWGYTTADARIPVGTDSQVLTADSSQSAGVAWKDLGAVASQASLPGAFEYSLSQNITTTTATIPFDTEVFDPDNNYSNTAGEIAISSAGYYSVAVNVPVNDDSTAGATRGRVYGWLEKDGGTGTWTTVNHIRGQVYEREASGGTGLHAGGIVNVSAGEKIRFRIKVSSSVDVSTETGEASLNIFKIGATAAGDMLQSVYDASGISEQLVGLTATQTLTNKTLSTGSSIASSVDVTEVLKKVYPVGSIYINATDSTNPATLLGFGTWVAFGAGRVPVGYDSSDTDFNTAEKTGGSKTHTLTVSEMPAHTHAPGNGTYFRGATAGDTNQGSGSNRYTDYLSTATASTGGGSPHTIVQPYITVYMWKRTA